MSQNFQLSLTVEVNFPRNSMMRICRGKSHTVLILEGVVNYKGKTLIKMEGLTEPPPHL